MEQKKLIDADGYCFVCGNNGFVDKVCPSCGKQPRKLSFGLEDKSADEINSFLKKVDKFGIPDKYKGIVWNADVLSHYKVKEADNEVFKRYTGQLDKIHTIFSSGMLPGKSAIIISPAGYSKRVFAYSCMQFAADNGFKVAPILDTVDLKRLMVLAMDKPQYKLFNAIDYDDYVMSDVCFVEVTKLPQHEYAASVIQEIIDKRARFGLSTFILSNYQLSEISKRDKGSDFDALMTSGIFDDYKYPAIIRYNKII